MKALHLLPNPKDAGRNMNLLGLLNHCKTPQGTRLLETWIRQPLANQSDILQRQDICETLIQETVLRQSLQENHLKALPDFLRISKKFGRTTGHLQGVVRMYQAVIRLPGLIDVLECNLNNHIALFDVVYVSKLKVCQIWLIN
jgi:DNA mismatch repair protein MSH2